MKLLFWIFFSVLTFSNAYLDVILDYCEIIEQDTEYLDFSGLKVTKVNKTQRALSGTVNMVKTLDDETDFEGLMYRKMGGVYGLLPFKLFLKPFCVNMSGDDVFWPECVKGFKFPGCPIPAGNYTGDTIFSLENFPKAALPYGEYAFEVMFSRNSTMVMKFRVYATIVHV